MALPLTRMVVSWPCSRSAACAVLLAALASPFCTGCGNVVYSVQARAAANKVEEAHELGAETLAPYEYYYAKEHLEKAEEEAAEASYSDARALAEESEDSAGKAIIISRDANRGAGR
jgi:hypothetical protein